MIEVLIVHYNTPELTEAAIRSLWKHTPDARVTVFDNSDRLPMRSMRPISPISPMSPISPIRPIRLIDNTRGQIVDWRKWLAQFPDKMPCPENDWGSAKHTYSVELCMDRFPDGFFLMDSDVLVRQDITPLRDPTQAFVGETGYCLERRGFRAMRVLPMLCWINTPMLKRHGIHYFNPERTWKLTSVFPNCWYDTGASFFQETADARLPYSTIKTDDYILHYGNGSWNQHKDPLEWLEENKELWKDHSNSLYGEKILNL